jgi:hypothetical protein
MKLQILKGEAVVSAVEFARLGILQMMRACN